MIDEYFPIVDEDGNVTGKETRKKCHAGTFLLHPVVHLHIINKENKLYLQKRSFNKDIQPGKWDTAVGGHVDYGESINQALNREAKEELGIANFQAELILKYIFQSKVEKELVHTHITHFDGEIFPCPDEISEGRFWVISDIENAIGKDIFTPNFEQEFLKLKQMNIFP